MSEKLLNTEEIAKYLGISIKAVEDLVATGRLPAYKIGGAFLRFKREHADAIKGIATLSKPSSIYRQGSFFDKIADFLYFNDFYIISLLLITMLAFIIIYT